MLFLIQYLYLFHMSVSVHLNLGMFVFIFFFENKCMIMYNLSIYLCSSADFCRCKRLQQRGDGLPHGVA